MCPLAVTNVQELLLHDVDLPETAEFQAPLFPAAQPPVNQNPNVLPPVFPPAGNALAGEIHNHATL